MRELVAFLEKGEIPPESNGCYDLHEVYTEVILSGFLFRKQETPCDPAEASARPSRVGRRSVFNPAHLNFPYCNSSGAQLSTQTPQPDGRTPSASQEPLHARWCVLPDTQRRVVSLRRQVSGRRDCYLCAGLLQLLDSIQSRCSRNMSRFLSRPSLYRQ